MTMTRRELLQAGLAVGLTARVGAAADTHPLLGLIAPPANYPVPPEALTLYGSQIRFTVFGLGLQSMTPAGYDSVIDKIVPAARQQAREGASAISIFGTSLTFYRGAAFNQKLIDDVHKATGLPTTSMSTAVVEGLKSVGAHRIAVATAYNDEVNHRLESFLHEEGFHVLSIRGLGVEKVEDIHAVTQQGLLEFSAGVFGSAKGADALLVSCGGLHTLDLLAPLEQRCGAPVVSSLPHALRAGVRLLGLSGRVAGYGRLLSQ